MVKGKIGRILIPLILAATLVATSACTPSEIQQLEGILQNVDSANGKITIVTNDGKTVTLKITTETEATSEGANVTVSALKPGSPVEVEVREKEQTAKRIKARHAETSENQEGSSEQMAWGIVEMRVTDPPPAGVKSAVVSLSNIEVHKAVAGESDNTSATDNSSGWIPIITGVTSFDLMSVIGIEQVLGSANLTAGKYTQIRMSVTNVTGVTTDNVSYTAEVPSGKLKIVGGFYVGDGDKTVLTLDFDGEKSLIRTGQGKFLFKPVVKLLVKDVVKSNEARSEKSDSDNKGGEGKGNSDNSSRSGKDKKDD